MAEVPCVVLEACACAWDIAYAVHPSQCCFDTMCVLAFCLDSRPVHSFTADTRARPCTRAERAAWFRRNAGGTSHRDYILDPIQVLRTCFGPRGVDGTLSLSDVPSFGAVLSADLFGVLMRVLRYYARTAREASYPAAMGTVESSTGCPGRALAVLQDTAIAGVLANLLLLTLPECDQAQAPEAGEAERVRVLLCNELHYIFIKDPTVMQAVHFEGYDHRLLSLLVEGVPSMHYCQRYVPDLLARDDQDTQMFAIRLGAALARRYPLPTALQVCQLVLAHIRRVAEHGPFRLPVIASGLAVLPVLVKAFPSLGRDIVDLLCHMNDCLGPVSPGDMASSHTIQDPGQHRCRQLVRETLLAVAASFPLPQ